MRHVRIALALAAVALVALPATALAKKPGLGLTEGESKTPAKSARLGVLFRTCLLFADGSVSGNGSSKVAVKFTGAETIEACGEGIAMEGSVSEVKLSSTGAYELKGKLIVTRMEEVEGGSEAECSYEYKKFKPTGVLTLPSPVVAEFPVVGKRTKKSAKTCAATNERELSFVLTTSVEPFKRLNAELT